MIEVGRLVMAPMAESGVCFLGNVRETQKHRLSIPRTVLLPRGRRPGHPGRWVIYSKDPGPGTPPHAHECVAGRCRQEGTGDMCVREGRAATRTTSGNWRCLSAGSAPVHLPSGCEGGLAPTLLRCVCIPKIHASHSRMSIKRASASSCAAAWRLSSGSLAGTRNAQ